MIKLKDELVNFPEIDLNALSNSNNFPENVRTAVSLYNKAIERIKFNSSDIAMIELKKAIKIFPDFYDAILLLSLCYYSNDEKTKALNLLNTIKDPEERNKCLRYLDTVVGKNLSGVKSIRRQEAAQAQRTNNRTSPKHGYEREGPSQNQRGRSGGNAGKSKTVFSNILNNPLVFRGAVLIVILLIAGGLVFGLYTLYNVNKKAASEDSKLADLENKYNTELERANKAEEELKNLRKNDEELIKNYILPMLLTKYQDKENQYEDIVKIIYLIDTSNLTDIDSKNKIQAIKTDTEAIFAQKTYDNAANDIVEGKYNDACEKLESIRKYVPSYDKIEQVMLELGKSYKAAGNKESALAVLNELVEYYGQSTQAVEAKSLINELKGDQEDK